MSETRDNYEAATATPEFHQTINSMRHATSLAKKWLSEPGAVGHDAVFSDEYLVLWLSQEGDWRFSVLTNESLPLPTVRGALYPFFIYPLKQGIRTYVQMIEFLESDLWSRHLNSYAYACWKFKRL